MKQPNGATKRALRREADQRNETVDGGRRWRALDLLITMLAVFVLALAVRGVLAEPVRVDGNSMQQTLFDGDYLFVEKLTYLVSKPKVGDIIICYYPDEYYESRSMAYNTRVKRVVATAGDTVHTEAGLLFVNGIAVSEPFLSVSAAGRTDGIPQTVTVGENEVYVLGDNRTNSNDSRNSLVGAIPMERIVGKVHFVLFPFSRFGEVH